MRFTREEDGREEKHPVRTRNLLLHSLAVVGLLSLPASAAHALLVKVSINFGPTITGPDNGTLVVTASPGGNPNAPSPGGEFDYFAWSDGAPFGFAGNGGELWRIDDIVTTPVTDAATDMTYTIGPGECFAVGSGGACPGTSATNAVSASLRINLVPEPNPLLLLGLALAGLARFAGPASTS